MRSALLSCTYVPKHAAPREPLAPHARSVLAVGLAAAVLPLGAAPALADDAPSTTGSAGPTATASPSASPSTSSSTDAPATSAATQSPAEAAPSPSASSPEATPSPYAVGASESPSASPSASPSPSQQARTRASTSLAFSAPSSARSTSVPVGIRLLSDGRAVRNGYVRLERSTSSGWTYVGRLLTNGDGVGKGTLKVAGSTRLRAAYTGSDVRTPAVSQPRTVKARTSDVDGSAVLQEAAKHVGKPYVYGAVGPDSFDCSGFTRYVYAQFGKSLPHSSRGQEQVTTPVGKAEAQPGDLVFIQDVGGHVGIYAGGGRMYDAPRSGKTVTLRSIWTANYTVGRVR